MRLRMCAVVLLVAACPAAYAAHSVPVSNPVYFRYIAAPAYRTARAVRCRSLTGQSVPVDRSGEGTTERSQWSGMKLLTRQLDCRYLAALYTELYYAVRHDVLGPDSRSERVVHADREQSRVVGMPRITAAGQVRPLEIQRQTPF